MSRYYIKPGFRKTPNGSIRDKRFDRYYNEKGLIVFNPDLSPWEGPAPTILKDITVQMIWEDHQIVVPKDFIHNRFKTPNGQKCLVRMRYCGYDLPTDTIQTTTGADASDGLKINIEEELKNKTIQS